jgi:hypothetical protein
VCLGIATSLVSGWCPRQDSNLRHRLRRAALDMRQGCYQRL